MTEFVLDPALFGVAGPSTSITGRVRQVPKQLQPLLSDSGSDKEEVESASSDDENDEDDDGEEDDARNENGNENENEDEDEEESEVEQVFSKTADEGSGVKRQGNSKQLGLIQPPNQLDKGKSHVKSNVNAHSSIPLVPVVSLDADTDYQTDVGDLEGNGSNDLELRRLVSAIRDTSVSMDPTTASNRGLLGQEWDRTMQQELDDIENENVNAAGGSGRRKSKKGRGRVALGDTEPSPEVRNMLGRANMAYVQGETKQAVDILTEIIRIEPSTKKAWYTLSSIHDDLGHKDKALQLRIVPAHLTRSNAETWKELGSESNKLGLLEQAIYCYGQAIKADRSDIEAIWDRANLLRITGKTKQAINGFSSLLKLQPHDPNVLREIGPLCYQIGEINTAIVLYGAAFDYFRSSYPIPTSSSQIQGFSTTELEMLSDLLRSLRRYREAAKVIVDGQRWLQGRNREEGTWNTFGDDREFDMQRKSRDGWADHPQRWCEDANLHHLDTGLRLRLGLCRLFEGRLEEARVRCIFVTTRLSQ